MRLLASDLRGALRITAGAITTRPAAPILAGVRIAFDGERQAEFRATDWNNWISTRARTDDVGEPFDVIVAHRVLAAIAKMPTARLVDLRVDGNRLHITAGAAKWSVPIIGAVQDFAQWPDMPAKFGAMTAQALQDALRAVVPAAGREAALPQLLGVAVEPVGDGRVRLSATNRFQMHAATAEFASVGEGFTCLPVAAHLDRAAGELAGELTLYADKGGNLLGMEDDRSTVLIRTVDAKPFAVDQFFAKAGNGAAHTLIDSGALIAALEAASPVLEEKAAVVLLVTADGVTVRTSGADGGCEIPVEVEEHVGRGISVMVNPAFLAASVKAAGGDTVRLDWDSPTRPVVISGPGARAVLMLVFLNHDDSRWLS